MVNLDKREWFASWRVEKERERRGIHHEVHEGHEGLGDTK